MAFENKAVWAPAPNSRVLEVGPGPTPNPTENEVVIKVAYVAINPADYKLQEGVNHLSYPCIYGIDIAGTIMQLGSKVTQFELGQRVTGHCDSLLTRKPTNAAFQLYSTCIEHLVSVVPESLPLVNAAVLPVSVDTAATALYINLKLPLPSLNPSPTGKRVLIWGGSSSVGCSAIQFAAASGFEVVTTASSANHELVKSLGSDHAFDYKEPDVVDRILDLLKPGDHVVDCISTKETEAACAGIVKKIQGDKFVVTNYPSGDYPDGVEASFAMCVDAGHRFPEVGDHIWHKFLPTALAEGKFQAKPDPHLIKGGLEKIPGAIDLLREGVSAKKIVVEILAE
ncbi:alcohol dehydrogenase [Penicillium angulare]|uniref:alcohol dehydrogenase n=1 Tax=Penicillium angulare TaxID=116970 RepID=UPI00253FD8CB|nr:alcohol dehydrogenase [Penicillium angulare]KAJ5279377.1 alcohol dehydrogenase [Penicillium angulare]